MKEKAANSKLYKTRQEESKRDDISEPIEEESDPEMSQSRIRIEVKSSHSNLIVRYPEDPKADYLELVEEESDPEAAEQEEESDPEESEQEEVAESEEDVEAESESEPAHPSPSLARPYRFHYPSAAYWDGLDYLSRLDFSFNPFAPEWPKRRGYRSNSWLTIGL